MTVVVLIPDGLDDITVDTPHVTLAYFGEEDVPDYILDNIKDAAEYTATFMAPDESVGVIGTDWLGELNESYVLLLDNHIMAPPNRLRSIFLDSLSDEARDIFEEVQTWDTYTPHITMGYRSPQDNPKKVAKQLDKSLVIPRTIRILGIGVWNDDTRFDYFPEGVMPRSEGQEELSHYGTPRKSGRY